MHMNTKMVIIFSVYFPPPLKFWFTRGVYVEDEMQGWGCIYDEICQSRFYFAKKVFGLGTLYSVE